MEELLAQAEQLKTLINSAGWQMVADSVDQFIANCEASAMSQTFPPEIRVNFLEQIRGAKLVVNAPRTIRGQIAEELLEYGYNL
jgi:hypothetical protein